MSDDLVTGLLAGWTLATFILGFFVSSTVRLCLGGPMLICPVIYVILTK